MKKQQVQNKIIIYQAKSGAIELRGDTSHDTIWATQAQIAKVFDIERSVATKHIHNILKDKELDANSVCAKFAHTESDGKTYKVSFYNLDIILAVGYRANSVSAITFRQWATKTLREHITKGYTINRKQIAKNYDAFMKSVGDIQLLLPEHLTLDPKSVIDPIVDGNKRSGAFAFVWFLRKAKIKTMGNINPSALTALTLLVAESDPKKKDQMTALITQILN